MVKRSLRVHHLTALLLAAALTVTACGSSEKKEPKQSTAVETQPTMTEPVQSEQTPVSAFTAPLTGLPVEQEAKLRPIAVMVNNYKAARPQSGLTQADVVWEALAEGGITRLVAIFQSATTTDPIGPIRSIRPYLIDIGDSYHAVLVHAGASNDAYDILQHHGGRDYLDEISNAGAYYWRDKSRKAPHNLYSDLGKMRDGAERKKYTADVPIPSYTFASEGAGTYDGIANTIDIKFLLEDYKVNYSYDAAKNVYLRSINGEAHIDLNNNEQLSASNVVVIGADQQAYDNVGRMKVDLSSGGKALLFQNGQAVACEWTRQGTEAIRLVKDGKELQFIPGHTYFHVVPNKPTFEDHVKFG
ncbi:DUF3048 domain-containing protein [Paenibacillus xylaniclasticus]|uniref:DUF3048 domain-containing protein n=1 Tax=Paenibacillus xylaniclasticus TaxID=588083 RepID=UPI000FDCBB43|nr:MULTISPECIES: DUF3048 domain-containing protein [Paenibacillus]GFN33264.1 putative lipoprotein YerB [Paenibacillus curdlanolyticus]